MGISFTWTLKMVRSKILFIMISHSFPYLFHDFLADLLPLYLLSASGAASLSSNLDSLAEFSSGLSTAHFRAVYLSPV